MILLILSVITLPSSRIATFHIHLINLFPVINDVVKSIFLAVIIKMNPPAYFAAHYHGLALTK
jgi:hypothetical protein